MEGPKVITMANLVDGDVFTLDGKTWHTCCTPLWGCVAIYLPGRRVGWNNSLTVRINAERDLKVSVRQRLARGTRAVGGE